jgi:hypothetical protein
MIEELAEYLIRHGYSEDVADDVHTAYYHRDIEGVKKYAKILNDEKHDYIDKIVQDVKNWRKEVGED